MYLYMNILIFGNSSSGSVTHGISTPILKSTGGGTPAPTSKILRWKDLETAIGELSALEENEKLSTRSIFGSDIGQRDVLSGDEIWSADSQDFEELFV